MERNDLDSAGFEDTQPTQPAELAELTTRDNKTDDLAEGEGSEKVTLIHLSEATLPLLANEDMAHRSDQAKEQAALVLSRLKTRMAARSVDLGIESLYAVHVHQPRWPAAFHDQAQLRKAHCPTAAQTS